MTSNDWLQIIFYFAVLFLCVKPLGLYMAKVYTGERTFMSPVLGWLERLCYRACGINPEKEMGWKQYATALVAFGSVNFLILYAILRLQDAWSNTPGVAPDLAFNIALSFITNTDWQAYSGETALDTLTQTMGLSVQNFISASVGIAVSMAFVRGFTRRNSSTIGNFWADVMRGVLYILLPLSIVFSLTLVSQGVVQTFAPTIEAKLVEPLTYIGTITKAETPMPRQQMAAGLVASQVATKQLSAGGGGHFGANAAHPFENPTPLSNFLQLLTILLIPSSLYYTFGRMAGDTRQGWVLLATATLILIPLMLFCITQEQGGNPLFASLDIDQSAGNMEGKETRFGVFNSAFWASLAAASGGSTNAQINSFTPLGTLAPLTLMQFGETIFGGTGSGLISILISVVIAVFLGGLMVGRTPEYLGKKIGVFDIKMAALAILAPHLATLVSAALAVTLDVGKAAAFNPGTQGFTEIIYGLTSAGSNNGGALSGLSANTPFYNVATAIAMMMGRYFIMIPALAMAGSFASKNIVQKSTGTLPTTTPLFVFVLTGVIIIGVLTFLPILALGPIAEHLNLMNMART